MFKKLFLLLLFSINSYAFGAGTNCSCYRQHNELTLTQSLIVLSVLSIGGVLAAPFVLPASAVAVITTAAEATKAAVCASAPFIIPITTVGQVSLGLTAAHYIRPCILQI